MGANEKHDATYHGGEFTPNTDRVQVAAVDGALITQPEFDRWLATVRAEAKAEAWDECANHISDVDDFAPPRLAGELKQANPYK